MALIKLFGRICAILFWVNRAELPTGHEQVDTFFDEVAVDIGGAGENLVDFLVVALIVTE
ncbi:MAG: hypothetical protein GX567_10300 [Clostridia bacterium]|nr:hypothetical protein [Clostridia bacterium]